MSKYPTVIPIELDKPRNIKITFNTLKLIEKATGKNTLKQETWENMSASDMIDFLWACLVHEDKDLKAEDVGEMIHPGNMKQVSEILSKAFKESTSQSDDSEGSGEKNENRSTG